MKTTSLLLTLAISATLTGCGKSDVAPNDDLAVLHERFNGKYKIVASTTTEAVDLNRDGQATTNLLEEIEHLSEAELELRIPFHGYNKADSAPLFVQFWQNQHLMTVNADTVPTYVLKIAVREFRFSPDAGAIQVIPDEHPDRMLIPFPDDVAIESNDNIRVVMQMKLYTSSGWKDLQISTLYERYTD